MLKVKWESHLQKIPFCLMNEMSLNHGSFYETIKMGFSNGIH